MPKSAHSRSRSVGKTKNVVKRSGSGSKRSRSRSSSRSARNSSKRVAAKHLSSQEKKLAG